MKELVVVEKLDYNDKSKMNLTNILKKQAEEGYGHDDDILKVDIYNIIKVYNVPINVPNL